MYKSVLTKVLKTFSLEETKNFREFINSPYFNKKKSVIKFYDHLIKGYPDFNVQSVTKEQLFEKLFPGKKYNDNQIRVLSHFLFELAEKFITVKRFENNNAEFFLSLSSELVVRGLYPLFDKNISKSLNYFELENSGADEIFLGRYNVNKTKYLYTGYLKSGNYEKIDSPGQINSIFKELKNFYNYKTITLYLNSISYPEMYRTINNISHLKYAFEKIDSDEIKDVPVILTYYFLVKMLLDKKDESYFFNVKKLLSENKSEMTKYDKTGIYVNLLNYCTVKEIEGNTLFLREKFILYKEEIVEKTYQNSKGYMSPFFYRNAVTTGLALNEINWTDKFIEIYKNELPDDIKDNYYSFCKAQFEFSLKNFETSLGLLSLLKHDEIYLKASSKILQLQIYFELNHIDNLTSALESFRHYISNDKLIPEKRKLSILNFYKFLNSLVLITNKTDNDSELMFLRKKIQSERSVISKNWLLEKTGNLL